MWSTKTVIGKSEMDFPVEHRVVTGDGIELHCATAGDEKFPMVLLLHGFPARWSTWRVAMSALANAGFFAVAPDLRGAGESEKPKGNDNYSIAKFVNDNVAIIQSLCKSAGKTSVFLVGHDFGGGVAWATTMFHPELVKKLAILNSVHPVGFERQMKKWSQIKKSWYVFFFLLPWLPEWWLSRNDFRFLKESLMADGLSRETVDDLLTGIDAPGALTAALAWYRASFRDGIKKRFVPQKVETETLVIWGDRETHLDPELANPPSDFVTNVRVEHVPNAGHWVQHDAPDEVAALLIAHFRA
jgi:epoxide hydrolase 4